MSATEPCRFLLEPLVPVAVECVTMRKAFLSGPHLAYVRPPEGSDPFPWPAHLGQKPTPVVTLPPDLATRWAMASDLTPALQLALLALRTTELAKACASKLRHAGVYCCGADHVALKQSGLAIPVPGKSYLQLTPQGKWKADEAAKIVAKQYGIHMVVRGGGYRCHTIRCSCGWTTTFTCSPSHKERMFQLWELRHLQKVET